MTELRVQVQPSGAAESSICAPHSDASTAAVGSAGLELTVIVPTRNKSGNVAALVVRLERALQGRRAEVLFVDDSDDDTPDRIRDCSATATIPVRMLHRVGSARLGGLGSAVRDGLRATASRWAIVTDGDLQHPPETIIKLNVGRLHRNSWSFPGSSTVQDYEFRGVDRSSRLPQVYLGSRRYLRTSGMQLPVQIRVIGKC